MSPWNSDDLAVLLKLGCEVHLDCFPADCPRRKPTFECEAYHRTTQQVAKSAKHLTPDGAIADVLRGILALIPK